MLSQFKEFADRFQLTQFIDMVRRYYPLVDRNNTLQQYLTDAINVDFLHNAIWVESEQKQT